LRERAGEDDSDGDGENGAGGAGGSGAGRRPVIEYKQGLAVAQRIKALRYLGKSEPLKLQVSWVLGDGVDHDVGYREQEREK